MTKVYRDKFGIPHLRCQDYIAAAYSIAYVHCEDDFYTIQLWLLASRKKSGHIDDWDGPYIDFICDFLAIEKYANQLKEKISNEYLSLVHSYCKGINQYATDNPDEILKNALFPISDLDVIKTQHLMEILGIQLDKPYSYISKNRKIKIPKKQGSNVIAVTKSKTQDGNAKIAINPHQQMEGLFSFYEIHLKIDDQNIELYGFVLPCTFTIFMGTNFNVAWGFTANYPEMYDIYKLKVSGILNKEINTKEIKENLIPKYYTNYTKFYGKLYFPIIKKFYQSKYGNVFKINGDYLLFKIPILGNSLGSEINYKLTKCLSNSEVKQLCFTERYGYLNLVSIDINDNILFVHNALEQSKKDNDLHLKNFIDLKSDNQLHNNYYEATNLIFLENPECDYIVSANQSPFKVTNKPDNEINTSKKGLLYYNENSRSIRIKSLLENKKRLDNDYLKQILADTKVLKPIIRNVDFSVLFNFNKKVSTKLSTLISLLKKWDGEADLDSEGAALFSFFYHRYKEKYYIASKNPDHIQTAKIDEILDCLNWASKFHRVGMKLKDVQFLRRGEYKIPINGIPDSISSIRPYFEKGKLYAEEGGAFRLVIDLKNRKIFACHPYGSSSDLKNKNATDQMKIFADNNYREIKPFEFYEKQYEYYTL